MTPTPTRPPPEPRRPAFGNLSLERKLPLLMTALLIVVIAASLVITHATLTRAAEISVRERLARAARQIAATAASAMTERATMMRAVAADTAVRRFLTQAAQDSSPPARRRSADRTAARVLPAVRAVLQRLRVSVDSTLAVELWSANGERLVSLDEMRPQEAGAQPTGRLGSHPVAHEGLSSSQVADSVTFGNMYESAGRVYFWVVAPVLENGVRIGYVAQQRRVTGPARISQSMRDLTGEDVTMYMRNPAGDLWAAAPGLPASPPLRDTVGDEVFDTRPSTGRMLSAEAPVVVAPWFVVFESPLSSVLARPRATLLRLVLLSLVLTILAAVLSWVISRRITRPLASLTRAAEAIATGDYTRRVPASGNDEVGRLAASFNRMASEVDASRQELEQQVEEAQSTAEELEITNQQLQETTAEAHEARAQAERANRAKSDFLAVMSHELRTPLNAIGGYAQLLEMEIHGPVTEPQRDALIRITRSQAHLLTLINDVLNFAKIDAGQVKWEITDVPIDETLLALEALVAPQVGAERLQFTYRRCDATVTVRADREKLQQIVLNLLTNAIKFTPEGGTVAVECETSGEFVQVRVHDTGIGIRPERLLSIFDPFVQGDRALNRPHEGVGLGLAISRDLARGMGGDLEVKSEVGRGSTFTLTLPRSGVGSRELGVGRQRQTSDV